MASAGPAGPPCTDGDASIGPFESSPLPLEHSIDLPGWAPLESWAPLERVGAGATSVVWRARHRQTGRLAALKLVCDDEGAHRAALAREGALLARVARRWGPALLDAGDGYVATEWTEGISLARQLASLPAVTAPEIRERLAARVAHGVARALEELHEAGVRHGDVKAANVLLTANDALSGAGAGSGEPDPGRRDAAVDRSVTLIDLGLATDRGTPGAHGGTRHYASPELRARGEAGPASDLWALGVLVAEVLDPTLQRLDDPAAAFVTTPAARDVEPARWARALVATAPGGRPSAGWVAARAAAWLGLARDDGDAREARVERVRRAYLRERARELVAGARVAAAVGEPARAWLEDAIAWEEKIKRVAPAEAPSPGAAIGPLSTVRRARWLVSLVGPSAAAWPLAWDGIDEDAIVRRAVELARDRDPESWTLADLRGAGRVDRGDFSPGVDRERTARLVRELAHAAPSHRALVEAENDVASGDAPPTLIAQLACALTRGGETGRAWVALAGAYGPEADALRAEVARRRGDVREAEAAAGRAIAAGARGPRSIAQATLARLAWDAGDTDEAERRLDGAEGPSASEVRALVAWRRGRSAAGLADLDEAFTASVDDEARARLEGVRGVLLLSRGSSGDALVAFARAVELAARAGAVVEEATYLTSEAAAAVDAGQVARALTSATRAALLWERLGRPERAARAWLARAGALALVGAAHAADEAADEAYARACEAGDRRAAAYARWARVEVRPPGDSDARAWAIEADAALGEVSLGDRVRATARRLLWAPDTVREDTIFAIDRAASQVEPAARWEWWGARAQALVAAGRGPGEGDVLGALAALVEIDAPVGSRGPALSAAVRLATRAGDGAAARRFEVARIAAARVLREGSPPELLAVLAGLEWLHETTPDAEVAFAPAQVAQLEAIVRGLSGRDRLRPLLDQVLDAMVLWAGVERGLLLMRAPDGRLVPRAARNLARRDIAGEQLALSQTIARRALETGDTVVATDAFSSLGDLHASVHALRLRSVLAVPLFARGESLGVVYLDDRVRKGAFGPRELAWVRVVASQAAMAIADARDAVLLRRAARRAERARSRVESLLREREAELDVARTRLELARDGGDTRYAYDDIAGRSESMRTLLRLVDRVTASDVPVLVVGESGTGKELIARAMHRNGARARKAFVSENCASVPETLLESTLFGHVRGAFTGASSARSGLFEVADGGTLLLDEIGEMSLGMQAKLLRVLQDGEVRPVGGERVRKVDVRIIGATHRDLASMVAAGSFREDLFYRLNVVSLSVPPLRDRAEDIPLLVAHFVRKHAPDRSVRVSRAALSKLTAFAWPGNVRQLENEIRRALVLGDGAIDVTELSADVVRGGPAGRTAGLDLRARVDALESELLHEALTKTRGNQTRAAQLLGLSRFGLQKMMKRLGVKMPDATG